MSDDKLLEAERRAQDLRTRIAIFCEQVRAFAPGATMDQNVNFLSKRMAHAQREWIAGTMSDLGIWDGDWPKDTP